MVMFDGMRVVKPQHRLDGSTYKVIPIYVANRHRYTEYYSIEGKAVPGDYALSDVEWALAILRQRAPVQIDWYADRFTQNAEPAIPSRSSDQMWIVSRP